ncbi:hypothetical protein PoB_002638000 [Plakobranchus ocellatus]|uniref:Uncharacterized protein n=1 Tax=Plakobranchus ocellatus TaxID=259542 RepID=A0AAV3ZVJ6_9GAST|nr:hypothetical protein PoB_002638000 [Plakobranchus ocellatus]
MKADKGLNRAWKDPTDSAVTRQADRHHRQTAEGCGRYADRCRADADSGFEPATKDFTWLTCLSESTVKCP